MMVEFLYDFSSPHSYVAYHKLREVRSRQNFEVRFVPIFLGGIFKVTNDAALPAGSLEFNYMGRSLKRLSGILGIEFNFPVSIFPVNSLKALRGSYYAESHGKIEDYISEVFRAYWASGKDISDPRNLKRIVESLGLDADDFLRSIETDEVKQRLRADTEGALSRGVFGAPTYFVDGEMFWGSPEVLWFLDEHLKKKATRKA